MLLARSLREIRSKESVVDTILFLIDNQAIIKLTNNPVNHLWVKQIDCQYHKLLELISDIVLKLDYIEISKMVTNRLTKLWTLVKHKYFVTILRLVEKCENTKSDLPLPPPPAIWMEVLKCRLIAMSWSANMGNQYKKLFYIFVGQRQFLLLILIIFIIIT